MTNQTTKELLDCNPEQHQCEECEDRDRCPWINPEALADLLTRDENGEIEIPW